MTLLRKIMLDFALACVGVGPCGDNNDHNGQRKTTLEHNKAWLLAESGEELASADPQSVHSSFRFSFCSQVEVESFNMSSSASAAAAATFLMVNLEYESQIKEMKWRTHSLGKSISPVFNPLTRFSYSEILSATQNFSKGNLYVNILLVELNLIPLSEIDILCFVADRESVRERCLELCF